MATPEQIAALRLLIAEPVNAAPYTDAVLGAAIDAAAGDLNAAAQGFWVSKAASYSELVDTSEGGSSRKMSDLAKNALAMVKYFGDQIPDGNEPVSRGTRVAKLRRP